MDYIKSEATPFDEIVQMIFRARGDVRQSDFRVRLLSGGNLGMDHRETHFCTVRKALKVDMQPTCA